MKTTIDKDFFDKWKVAMHCKTEKECKEFCRLMHDNGLRWCSGNSYLGYDNCEGGTCYHFNEGTFSDKEFAIERGYTVLEFSDYIVGGKMEKVINKLNKLRDYIDDLHIRIDYEDYLGLIDYVDDITNKLNMYQSSKEDLAQWLYDNWQTVEKDINKTLEQVSEEYLKAGSEFDLNNVIRRHDLAEDISVNIRKIILNAIDTYDGEVE